MYKTLAFDKTILALHTMNDLMLFDVMIPHFNSYLVSIRVYNMNMY